MPTTKLYRRDFKYTPAAETNVLATWRKFGFRPTTYHQRRQRQGAGDAPLAAAAGAVIEPPRRPTLMLATGKK
jgi:hypothetical protein